jgi:hypothetical protein
VPDLTTKKYNLKAWNLKDERGVQILSKLVLEDLEGSLRSVRLTIKNFTDTEYVYFLIHLISNHLISLYDMIFDSPLNIISDLHLTSND